MAKPSLLRRALALAALLLVGACVAPARAENLALVDSIAWGAVHLGGLHATAAARVGAPSCEALRRLPRRHFDAVVVSAGVNDPPGRCLAALRAALDADVVVFVLPPPINAARAHIAAVAAAHGDRTVSYAPGRDGLHPRSYPALARAIAAAWRVRRPMIGDRR
jgi:hypothetical protein